MSFPGEERIVSDRLQRKLNDVNLEVQKQLSGVQDHVNFTLQQAYFKCAHECFDRRRRQEDINDCVEHCSVPVMQANGLVQDEMAKFQERLNRSLMVCQDKLETAKLQPQLGTAMNQLESCVDHAIQDNIRMLPHIVDRLKKALAMPRDEAKL
ncbi:hypothetical protein AMTRI_Chr06g178450 [Amborella trichopoda]|uniref:Protein FAM136A n=1 Tax=Amborella trichopoda TaxID=13333 RepID=U5DCJ1_AMBTC|nr:protein FAM136A [Amborella trichopoda]ERN20249.1 hypothetical protein AMTR_s00066p00158540 [Amborella trichopoda]|eukprot:XP_006858782.1 protein FAM136A [Amborella trichopoda]